FHVTGVQTCALPICELLRAGIAVEPRPAAAIAGNAAVGPRTQRVVRLALAYSQLLRDSGEVDAAEALWRAATATRSREPLLVYRSEERRVGKKRRSR